MPVKKEAPAPAAKKEAPAPAPAAAKKADKKAKNGKEQKPAAAAAAEAKPALAPVKSKELDARTLFIKNLPADCTEEELKSLSSDITDLRLRQSKKVKGKHRKFT